MVAEAFTMAMNVGVLVKPLELCSEMFDDSAVHLD